MQVKHNSCRLGYQTPQSGKCLVKDYFFILAVVASIIRFHKSGVRGASPGRVNHQTTRWTNYALSLILQPLSNQRRTLCVIRHNRIHLFSTFDNALKWTHLLFF